MGYLHNVHPCGPPQTALNVILSDLTCIVHVFLIRNAEELFYWHEKYRNSVSLKQMGIV